MDMALFISCQVKGENPGELGYRMAMIILRRKIGIKGDIKRWDIMNPGRWPYRISLNIMRPHPISRV